MIRMIQRRLRIPRGDTGSFSIPALVSAREDLQVIAVFSIFNEYERIFSKTFPVTDDMVTIEFTHEDTKDLPVGKYFWDIKIYTNPQYDENNVLIDGDSVDSYYAGFKLPECDITLAPLHGG